MEDIRYAPLLKVERAKSLLCELNDVVKVFVESEFYSIGLETDPDTGKKIARISIDILPKTVALITGDIIHNLRSSLDILWTSIVRKLGGNDAHAHFPFREERQDLERAVLHNEKVVVPEIPEIGRIIVDEVRPYKAGNFPIWAMNKLSVTDKHRLLLASANITKIPLTMIDEGRNMTVHQGAVFPSGIIKTWGMVPGYSIEDIRYGKPAVAVVFDISVVKGHPVFPALAAMGTQTERAIELIADAWDFPKH